MRKVQFGETGPSVSAMCLGAMYFGSKLDAAGSFIDTANIYAAWIDGCRGGDSERFLGEWMRARKNRGSLFISSKAGFEYGEIPRSAAAALIQQECEKSLERLGTDRIDLYFIHCDDPSTPLEETLEALTRLRDQGKIRYAGASNYAAGRLGEALDASESHGFARFCCIQQRHSFLTPAPGVTTAPQVVADRALASLCKTRSIGLMAYSPLIQGAYADLRKPLPEDYDSDINAYRRDVLKSVCRATGATGNQVVLAWMAQGDVRTVPLLGVSSTGQLEENLGALELTLTESQLRDLDAARGHT